VFITDLAGAVVSTGHVTQQGLILLDDYNLLHASVSRTSPTPLPGAFAADDDDHGATVYLCEEEADAPPLRSDEEWAEIRNSKRSLVLDTGATVHLFKNPSLLFNIAKKKSSIRFGNDEVRHFDLVGEAGHLHNVIVSETASKNLVSGTLLVRDCGFAINVTKATTTITDSFGNIISTGSMGPDGLIYLDDDNLISPVGVCALTAAQHRDGDAKQHLRVPRSGNKLQLLHERMGHYNEEYLKNLVRSGNVIGAGVTYDEIKTLHLEPCDACMRAKMKRLPSRVSINPPTYGPFEKVGSDLVGPISVQSLQGNRYFVLYVDYKTCYITVYFVRHKNDLIDTLDMLYRDHVQRSGRTMKVLQSDSESVFKDKLVAAWCTERGIVQHLSPAQHHQQNGKVERNVQTVDNMARTFMLWANAPAYLWEFAVSYAVETINCMPLRSLGFQSPHELIFGIKPDISSFIPFGTTGYVLKYEEEKKRAHKFDSVAEECMFLGHPTRSKNSFIVRLKDKRVQIRRDVVFITQEAWTAARENASKQPVEGAHGDTATDSVEDEVIFQRATGKMSDSDSEEDTPIKEKKVRKTSTANKQITLPIRRSERESKKPSHFQDYVNTMLKTDTQHNQENTIPTPSTVKQALSEKNPYRLQWKEAIDKEMSEMFGRRSLVEVTMDEVRSNNRVPFKSKFVFKVKKEPDGSTKFKARLVGCGYSQIKGIDYNQTYAPTPGFHLVTLLLHVAATYDWHVRANDIGNAYLEAQADTLLYMNLPKDYTGGVEVPVRLDGNINGTKQGALLWAMVIDNVLLQFGFKRSKIEPCLYVMIEKEITILVLVYVDDILIVGNSLGKIKTLQQHFENNFKKVTSQQEVKKFLGINIEKIEENGKKHLFIHQKDYIEEKTAAHRSTKTKKTPLPLSLDEAKNSKGPVIKPIHDLVGQARFMADRCRLDIAFAASFLARFSIGATEEVIDCLNRSFQYLNETKEAGIKLGSKKGCVNLSVYTDAGFAKEFDSKAQLCFCFLLCITAGCVLFKSWKDKAVSISTTQAEIHALVEAVKSIIWYRELLKEIGFPQNEPTLVHQDNINVVNLADLSAKDNHTKYLINKINFIREAIDESYITLVHVETENNLADLGTKSLDATQHAYLTNILMNGRNE
jgi:hypothetical protein